MSNVVQWNNEQLVLTIKPTNACNYRCAYCFQNHERHKLMDMATWFNILNMLKHPSFTNSPLRHITLYFHGGEPLLAGFKLLNEILTSFKDLPWQQEIIMLSNLSLINKSIANLLVKHKVKICTSLDGPKHLNDINRKVANEKSSFELSLKAIKIIREVGGDIAGINFTLTKDHLGKEEEIYHFFKELLIPFTINHVLDLDPNIKTISRSWNIDSEYFGESLIKFFDLWVNDSNPTIDIIAFKKAIKKLLSGGYDSYECATSKTICFDPMGMAYPCPSFNKADSCFGPITDNENSVPCILTKRLNFLSKLNEVKRTNFCNVCDYVRYCEGICTMYKSTHEINGYCHDISCKAKQKLYAHICKFLKHNGINIGVK